MAVCVAGVQVDEDVHLAVGEVDEGAVLADAARAAYLDAVDDTSSWCGSKAAAVVPTAASTRPQLGSLPKIAHLKRLLRATARATSSGVVLGRGGADLDGDVVAGALGVGDQLAGQIGADLGDGLGERLRCRPRPRRRPRRGARTVSLVDMQPSESMRSNVVRGGGAQHAVEHARLDHGVGRHHDEHRRQGRARACRRPWPCRRRSSRRGPTGLLVHGVGGLDGDGGVLTAVGRQRRRGCVDAGEQEVHGEQLADEAGGADHHIPG